CLLVREGELRQLTEDHAVRGSSSYLTRCIGAGLEEVTPDLYHLELQAGDIVLLVTDGLWSMVEAADILRLTRVLPVQEAAEELVRLANRHGGPDNSTVLIFKIQSLGMEHTAMLEVDLPRDEVQEPVLLNQARSLVAPRWPWIV